MGANSVGGLVNFAISVAIISVVAIVLRFWSRFVSPGVRCYWDDWLALAALPPALALCAVIIAGAHYGAGKHIENVSAADQTIAYKLQLAGAIVFELSISFSKLSALAFYSRVFRLRGSSDRVWKWCFYVTLALTIAWLLGMVPLSILRCIPVRKFWLPEVAGHCIRESNTYLAGALSSVIIDVMILVLPLPMIFRLQIKLARKILIAATFVVGYGAALMSVGRLITAAQTGTALLTDFVHKSIPISYWVAAEACLSIMVICLPAIFQLFNRGVNFGFGSLLHSRDLSKLDHIQHTRSKAGLLRSFGYHRKGADSKSNSNSNSAPRWTAECAGTPKGLSTSNGSANVPREEHGDVPLGSIQVRKDFDVAVHV